MIISESNPKILWLFWKTTQQREIDLIEDDYGKLHAFEFKRSGKRKVRFPQTFTANYPEASQQIVSPENMDEWLLYM